MAEDRPAEPLLDEWERRTDIPLTALSVAFLIGYAVQVLATVPGRTLYQSLDAVLWAVWAIFVLDYAARFALARRRWHFVRRNPIDLLVVFAPFFRFLRVLRLISALSMLNRQLKVGFRGRVGVYVTTTTALLSVVAALGVYEAERFAPESSITTFGDALWWVLTTITTVGYGDKYPVTVEGKLVAGGLMLAGIALLGTVTATIATWFTERLDERGERAVERVDGRGHTDDGEPRPRGTADAGGRESVGTDDVLAELRALHARLDRLEDVVTSGPADDPSDPARSSRRPG